MYIEKIKIKNFKCFGDWFELKLNKKINILVGNNEAGKSTILEAIHLCLSGVLNGRYLKNELTQYLFNKSALDKYVADLASGTEADLPMIEIELYFTGEESPELSLLKGNKNSEKNSGCGVTLLVEFDDQYLKEYSELIKLKKIKSLPIEYYKVTWKSFSRETVTTKSIPLKSALIDSSVSRLQNGSDLYVARIIKENLDDKERVEISQAHREMKETFMLTPSIKAINTKISASAGISEKNVTISVDLSTQNAWETSLLTYLDEIPFHFIGRGEQNIIKTSLALSHKKSQEANLILIDEPENHLSYSKLNTLIKKIADGLGNKQLILSTHSSFVSNKLGLENLILLNDLKSLRVLDLSKETKEFFDKLAGYDTLRLILCKKAILVEGDSDELVVQKAYQAKHKKLPIEDGIDVISVGTSFLRFLEVADKLKKDVIVITDNDGDVEALKKKYEVYLGANKKDSILVSFDPSVRTGTMEGFNYNTLEPSLLQSNTREKLNQIFETKYDNDDKLLKYMKNNKTNCALEIFKTTESVVFPDYINGVL